MQHTHTQVEVWRDIPGYEGHYQVSDHGRVRSLDRKVPNKGYGGTMLRRGRVLSMVADHKGYLLVRIFLKGVRKRARVHRLVLEAFIGPCPDGMECCHNDGDPSNNHISNLRWDTRINNRQDAIRHGNDPMLIRTHCPRGHELVAPNLRPSALKKGSRTCLACDRAKAYARKYNMLDRFEEIADDRYRKIMLAD